MLKRSKEGGLGASLSYISQEATKAYHSPAIVTVVKEIAEEKGLEDLAPHVSRTVVANIQQGLRRSHNAFLAGVS